MIIMFALLSPEAMVVKQPKFTRVGEPTLLCNHSCQRFSGWCLFFARGALCSLALMFKALNGRPQPVSKNLFDLALLAVPIQGVQRFTDLSNGMWRQGIS